MEFGFEKWRVVVMKRVFFVDFDGIEMFSGEVMKIVEEEWYKYYGVFELDNIMY